MICRKIIITKRTKHGVLESQEVATDEQFDVNTVDNWAECFKQAVLDPEAATVIVRFESK